MNSLQYKKISLPVMALLLWLSAGTGAVYAQDKGTPPLYTGQDMLFLINMISHHQQAVDMSALVPGRDVPKAFREFTGQVGRGQAAEIRLMESMLELAASRGLDVPTERTGHDHSQMEGMLTPEQMAELAAAEGDEFLRMWLQGMIYHHQGAITMANKQQRHQLETGRRPYGMDVLVEEIIVVQRSEINMMEKWLDEWNLR